MIEETSIHDADAEWRRGQQEILAKVRGLAHKTGETYSPKTSELLAFMLANLDPLYLAEQALSGMRHTAHLKFDPDTRLWNGVSEAEREEKRRAKEAARVEEARLKEERKAARAAGKLGKTRRGRVSIHNPVDVASWWYLFHEEMARAPSVSEIERFIEGMGNAITRRAFFRLWKKTKTVGLLSASPDPANGRRMLIIPGPRWADAGIGLPSNWQTAPTPASDSEQPFI